MVALIFWLCITLIVYTYLGYPVLLLLLAHFRPNPQPYPKSLPRVTLLIAAYNEEKVITQKIENSLALDYPRSHLQILVAADGSDDKTPDLVGAYANLGVTLSYSPPRLGKMAAINRAMTQATGDIIVFSDANNTYTPNTLQMLVAPFADATVGGVTGTKVILRGDGALGESEGFYWRYESWIKEMETRLGCCTGVAGEILAIRRHLFESPPDYIINDDFYIAMRLVKRGYRLVYEPLARSSERVSESAQDEVTRRARIIAGRYQAIIYANQLLPWGRPLIVWQIISHKFLRPLVPLAMIGAFVTNILALILDLTNGGWLALAWPYALIFLIAQLGFYGLAWLGSNKEAHYSTLTKILYLPTFLVNSNFAALIGLYRFLAKQQTTRWQRVKRREA